MKILLVYPDCPDTFWNLKYALKFISKKVSLPPLGLLTVAAMLPKQWEKKLIDMNLETLTDSDIHWADYVFISAMFLQKKSVEKIIQKCKNLRTKIVAGGPLFTSANELFDDIDHLILNEAEITLPLFLQDIKNGNPKHIYKSQQWADITKTPVPLWELLDMNKYAYMSMQYSRGCPFSCDFCGVTSLFGNKMRLKTEDQLLAELEDLYLKGWRGYLFIVDDNFIGNKNQLKKHLLPAMINWMKNRNYPFMFNTQVSINIADDTELMKLMVEAGFNIVFIGIETPHEKGLIECEKHQNKNRDLIDCVKKIQSYGLQVQGGFILGFDSDIPSIFDKLISFIQKSGIVTAMVGLLNAPRGTKLYDRLDRENRLLGDASGDNTDLSMNFIPKMDHQQLIEGYKSVISKIYSHKYYYERIFTLFKNYKPIKKQKIKIDIPEINALIKSIWYIGIKERGKIYYWKLILWTLFRRPQLLQLAITFAIYGFHFRKIFAKY